LQDEHLFAAEHLRQGNLQGIQADPSFSYYLEQIPQTFDDEQAMQLSTVHTVQIFESRVVYDDEFEEFTAVDEIEMFPGFDELVEFVEFPEVYTGNKLYPVEHCPHILDVRQELQLAILQSRHEFPSADGFSPLIQVLQKLFAEHY